MSQNRQVDSNEQRREVSINDDLPSSRRPFGITVEVTLFVILLSVALTGTVISNIILYRTCHISLNYPEEQCQAFLSPERNNNTKHLEEEVQRYATYISTVKTVIEAVGPAILSLFLSVWSDTHGRKPLIVWPMLGASITAMLTVVYSMCTNFGPWWYILAVIPFSLTGGFTVLFTGCYCYLNDITTSEKKSIRMVILEAAVSLGSVIGSIISTPLLSLIGNTYLLLLSATITVLGYVHSTICLTESLHGAIKGGLSTVADFLLVKEMLIDCFKRRPNNLRAQILLLTVANSLSIFILYGTFALDYLYVRQKLHWAMKEYMIYSASSTMVSFGGGLLGVVVVQKLFKMGDISVSIVAFISATAEYIIKMLATASWHMYLARSVSFLKGLSGPLIRSYLMKSVPMEDIAKIFALMCAIEPICPLVAPALFNVLYAETLSVFPGAFYLLATVITMACVVILGLLNFPARSVSFLKGLSAPLIRSHLTKTVPVEDIAKIFALICALEAICPLVAPLMFNSLYAETLSVFPGAFYLLSTSITMACVVMLGVVQYYRYKTVTPYNPLESDSVETVSDAAEDSHQD